MFIAKDKKLQIALIDYVNNNMFTKHQKWKVYSLLKEIYVCVECYEIEEHIYLENIYNWVLDTMFTKDFF